jgi:hypothetical protein
MCESGAELRVSSAPFFFFNCLTRDAERRGPRAQRASLGSLVYPKTPLAWLFRLSDALLIVAPIPIDATEPRIYHDIHRFP